MAKLYTGYGDKGYTQTINNKYIPKSDVLIEFLGTIDEFSSQLGAAKAHTSNEKIRTDIERIQKKMISVMGEVAGGNVSVTENCVKIVEGMTDSYVQGFEGFSLPGANAASAFLDIARCVIRRAERLAVKLGQQGRIRAVTLVYLNRLSDLVYAMSRYAENNE